MKLIVKAYCSSGPNNEKFDGLAEGTRFDEYVPDDWPKCVTGGYMRFVYHADKTRLEVLTEYDTKRKLTEEEEKIVIDYTQGQWSDGIGEGFEQQKFAPGVYNPSPWYHGQKASIAYVVNKDEEKQLEAKYTYVYQLSIVCTSSESLGWGGIYSTKEKADAAVVNFLGQALLNNKVTKREVQDDMIINVFPRRLDEVPHL